MTFLKTGFNGAAALQPRKAGRRRRPHAAGPAASMGPRLFSRGRGGLAVYKTSEWLASMGPRLFSRGRVTNTPTALSAGALQWGRGSSAAEGQGQQGTDTLPGGASMGPRLFSRGRYGVLPATVQFWELQWGRGSSAAEGNVCGSANHFVDSASMGPRLFSRGRFNAERGLPVSVFLLQWGRGSSAAEGRWVDVGSDAKSGRFNGAAALQPRKAARRNTILWVCRASMGPRLFSRGRDADVDGMFDLSDASMGPRLFSRGRSG